MEFIRITKVQGVFFEKGRSPSRSCGALHLTSHHLLFVPGENEPGQEVWICYSTIHSVDKKSTTQDGFCPLYIACRNFTFVRLFIRREQECNEVYATLQRLMNITSIESLFSFYYSPVVPFTSTGGWKVYDPAKEFARQGLGTATREWRLTDINDDYSFSPTYPRVLAVPAKISDAVLSYAVKFRSKGRLPALSYLHRKNMISITRASQPLSGLSSKRSVQDEKLVECIFTSGISPSTNNLIVDARPTVNAMANSVTGAGIESMENYKNCRLSFSGIDNIHVVRDSFNRVLDAIEDCRGPLPIDKLERSGWLRHIRNILDATLTIVQSVHLFNSHVLVHCSDGWDRTSQLASLAMLCLDPYYRTMEGFAVLVEKEWVSFGHKFAIRCGHLSRDEKAKGTDDIDSALPDFGPSTATALRSQLTSAAKSAANFFRQQAGNATGTPPRAPSPSVHRDTAETVHSSSPNSAAPKDVAPVFTQFLDCVYQIWRQFPTHFEFSDRFLVQLNTHLYSCQFGNFLFNNERERSSFRDAHGKPIEECTYSVWDWFASQKKDDFVNPAYIIPGDRAATQGAQLGSGQWNVAEDDPEILFPLTRDSNQRDLLEFWRTLFLHSDTVFDGMEQVEIDRGTAALDTSASEVDVSAHRGP
ncbi:Myotubularin-like phosphatase domain-containing protein [Hyaloraphidium curvatum]|nr:Myotubularin-like phosphatase domain-containing protein [Hyaloraphidium curvatum]